MMFPKPKKESKSARRKRRMAKRRELDPYYIWWIHGWPCANPKCGHWPVHAHHVVTKGRLGSDRTAIPLCPSCHLKEVHGINGGVKTCESRWNVNFSEIVSKYNKLFSQNEKGPYQDDLKPYYSDNIYTSN